MGDPRHGRDSLGVRPLDEEPSRGIAPPAVGMFEIAGEFLWRAAIEVEIGAGIFRFCFARAHAPDASMFGTGAPRDFIPHVFRHVTRVLDPLPVKIDECPDLGGDVPAWRVDGVHATLWQ